MLEIAREYTIQGAHSLPGAPDGHKCKRKHGHTWTIRVWLTGDVDGDVGWIVDFDVIDRIVYSYVVKELDHTDLNDTLPNPTVERIAQWVYGRIAQHLLPRTVTCIEVEEGPRSRARLTIDIGAQNQP